MAHVLPAMLASRAVKVSVSPHNDKSARGEEPRHPSYDPSGDEPAGSSHGTPRHDLGGVEFAEAESEQARGRRESAATRDNSALGPHDQESGDRARPGGGDEPVIRAEDPR